MRSILKLLALLCLVVSLGGSANAFMLGGVPGGATVGTLSIDGAASNGAGNVVLSTTKTNNIIVVYCVTTGGSVCGSITDTAGLVWTRRIDYENSGSNLVWITEFWALSTSILTSDTIVTTNGSRMTAFGVNGANLSTPFDPNVSLPATNSSLSGNIAATISTTKSVDMVISCARASASLGTITYPSGETSIVSGGANQAIGQRITASAQSSVSESYSFSTTPSLPTLLVDAIQASGQ